MNHCLAFYDEFPISDGHTLVVPKRHVESFFDLTPEELSEMMGAIKQLKLLLDKFHSPAAYNIGINDGPCAGQTIMHVHFHVIPRYEGDVQDARGGIRWIIPDRARYWEDD